MAKKTIQTYRNVSLLPGRFVPISAPHFGVSYLDERNVLANITAILAASSPTRGLFYSTMLPGSDPTSRTVFELLKKPLSVTRTGIEATESIGLGGYANRYMKILTGIVDLAKPRPDGENPLAVYMSTLKHSDLFTNEVGDKGMNRMTAGLLPATILGLIHEQSHTIVEYPIGAAVLSIFGAYVTNPQLLTDKSRLEDDTAGFAQSTESQYGKFQGKIIAAARFSGEDLTIPDYVKDFGLNPNVLLNELFDAGPLQPQLDSSDSGFVRSLIALDVLNNLDKIGDFLRGLSPLLLSNKPEDKIAAVRSVYSMVSSILFQPVLMYGHLVMSLLTNPIVKRHISAKIPHLYDGALFVEVETAIKNRPLSPIYAEVVRHFSATRVDTTFGEAELITVPKGLLNFLPFLQGASKKSTTIKAADNKAKGIGTTFKDLTLLNAGAGLFAIDNTNDKRTASLVDFITSLRGVIAIYFENAPETIADMTRIASALNYKSPAPLPMMDRASPNVIITDGLIASERLDYDTVVNSILMKPSDLLKSSPNKRVIIPNEAHKEQMEAMVGQFYEFKDLIVGANSFGTKFEATDQLADNALLPLLIRQDPWFERFSINASLLLNGRLPMSRYALDGDGIIIPHSTFANFASDLGMDPATLALYLEGAEQVDSLIGREVAALLLEFFSHNTKEDLSNIPDAEIWGVQGRNFRYPYYFTSSRAASYHLYAEVVVNQLVPSVQFIQYLEWSRTGHIILPVCRPLFIDKAFQSSMLSGEGVAAGFAGDIISRLK